MFGFLGTTEVILIVLAVFLLFGATRLPKLAKSLGQSRKAFKEGMEEAENAFKFDDEEEKQLNASPKISEISDEEFAAEMKRRQANQS